MDFQNSLLAFIDTRSFSNIWYWVALAVMWSQLSHYVLGVPYDMVTRARREGGVALADLEASVAAQVRRRMHVARASGQWMVALVACGLTVLALLGFVYGLQLGQAVFLLALPATLVALMGLSAARRLEAAQLTGEALCSFLGWLRFRVQLLGLVSIFVTTIWAVVQVVLPQGLSGF